MKKSISLLLVLVLLFSLCPAVSAATREITDPDFIVDTLDGVPAFPNRQCNELAIRYYKEVFGREIYVGDHSPYLSSNYASLLKVDDLDWEDIPDELSGFQHAAEPKKGDIVYWSAARRGKNYAHTALVKSYANGTITLVEQNWNSGSRAAYERTVKFPSEEYVVYTLGIDPLPEEQRPSHQQDAGTRVRVSSSSHKVALNGEEVRLPAYLIDSSNYFKLRDIAMLLRQTGSRFAVGYDAATKTVTVTTGGEYTPVGGELERSDSGSGIRSSSRLFIDGAEVTLETYNILGNNYFKLRDLAGALHFDVGYDAASKTVLITTE